MAVVAVVLFVAPERALAAWSNPAGAEGDILYNADYHMLLTAT